ncbi:MAG: HAD superfamily hydrolase (TIGR01549 family) [Psychromonas sp.]|jgi:HAD superfamily hydrolase (TIGR01549 family)|uniref:HAD family hydrolase n=1 Tax=Psychromonas sp. TaxID=1884585 RepID=UPI0039E6A6E9
MKNLSTIQALIFDLDNTLVSSQLNFKLLRDILNCPEQVDILDFIKGMKSASLMEQANDFIVSHEMLDALTSSFLPGSKSLLAFIALRKYPVGIVTRNCLQAATTKLKKNAIKVDILITREDYPAKPSPEALFAIAQLWGIDCQNIVYVGDHLYDVQAANSAGMISCLITHNIDLSFKDRAHLVFNELHELEDALKESQPVMETLHTYHLRKREQ